MATWGGEADKSQEGAGGGGFEPAPRGIYTIQVADFKDGQTQGDPAKGKPKRPMVTLECEIADEGDHFGKKVWVTIVHVPKGEKGHGLMLHYLHAFDIELDGSYQFDTNDMQGRQARALLGTKPYTKIKDGRTYTNEVNWVEEVYTPGHPEPENGQLPPPRQPRDSKPALAAAPAQASKVNPAVAKTFPGARSVGRQEEVPF